MIRKDVKGYEILDLCTGSGAIAVSVAKKYPFVKMTASDISKKALKVAKINAEKYKVTPVRINTVTIPAKNVIVRGKRGKKSGYKKAYIYLKKGEKIENI